MMILGAWPGDPCTVLSVVNLARPSDAGRFLLATRSRNFDSQVTTRKFYREQPVGPTAGQHYHTEPLSQDYTLRLAATSLLRPCLRLKIFFSIQVAPQGPGDLHCHSNR